MLHLLIFGMYLNYGGNACNFKKSKQKNNETENNDFWKKAMQDCAFSLMFQQFLELFFTFFLILQLQLYVMEMYFLFTSKEYFYNGTINNPQIVNSLLWNHLVSNSTHQGGIWNRCAPHNMLNVNCEWNFIKIIYF